MFGFGFFAAAIVAAVGFLIMWDPRRARPFQWQRLVVQLRRLPAAGIVIGGIILFVLALCLEEFVSKLWGGAGGGALEPFFDADPCSYGGSPWKWPSYEGAPTNTLEFPKLNGRGMKGTQLRKITLCNSDGSAGKGANIVNASWNTNWLTDSKKNRGSDCSAETELDGSQCKSGLCLQRELTKKIDGSKITVSRCA
jgi:hypothetical protein